MTKNRLYYYLTCGMLAVIAVLFVLVMSKNTIIAAPVSSNNQEITIVAGEESGEYYAVAKDIEKLAREKNMDIDVMPTRGALQNIHDVFAYSTVPLGITQADTLAFLNTFANDDTQARLQAENLRTLMPLYQEEVYIITSKDINSVTELAGKKVAIGDRGSGTNTTASTLLYQWGIAPEALFTYDIKRALFALREKEVDAVFYVTGMPSKVLNEQILPEDNFHLLPVSLETKADDEFYSQLYTPITLQANTYTWQSEALETLAVQSYLITTAEQDCQKIDPVVNLIKDNLSWFKTNGDSVWKNVDLNNTQSQKLEKVSQCVASK